MSEPTTEAGRAFHDELHAPGGAYEQVTGRAECGSLGCGSLASVLAIESEAREQGEKAAFEEVFPLELRKARADLARRIEARVEGKAHGTRPEFRWAWLGDVLAAIREEAAK